MRTPAGQQTALPDSGLYIAEPAKIKTELFDLQQARKLIEQQYAEAVRFRDRAGMVEARNKATIIDANIRLMENMQAIAGLQAGDVNQISQVLSRITGGQTRIQEIQPSGNFNVYHNGKLAYENVPKEALIASLRSQFDQQYNEMVSSRVKRQDEIELEQLKQAGETNRAVVTEEAKLCRERAIQRAEQQYNSDPRNQEYSATTQTAADGNPVLILTPKRGGGVPQFWQLEPDYGVDGKPRVDGQGNPVLNWKQKPTGGASTSTVPVQ
jgi:hypothetical protein